MCFRKVERLKIRDVMSMRSKLKVIACKVASVKILLALARSTNERYFHIVFETLVVSVSVSQMFREIWLIDGVACARSRPSICLSCASHCDLINGSFAYVIATTALRCLGKVDVEADFCSRPSLSNTRDAKRKRPKG